MAKILDYYNPEIRVSFDVDDTLVKFDGVNLITHDEHVLALKQHWARGHHVRVQSAGGGAWAKYVVDLLDLGDFVHETTAKDSWYIDDKAADSWMERYYIAKEGFNNGQSIGSNEEVTRDHQTSPTVPSVTYRGSSVIYPIPEVQGVGCTITSQAG